MKFVLDHFYALLTAYFVEQDEEDWFTPYKMAYTNTFGKPHWIDFAAKEYEACRERVGISDYSSFTKIDLWVFL